METNKVSRSYHRTTIDAAKLTYPTISRVGQKRTFDVAQGNQTALTDISNRSDFHPPALRENSCPPLKAAEINDVVSRTYSEHSQRRVMGSTSNLISNPLLDLSHPAYGLPEVLVRNFGLLGIQSIYPWQSECLLRSGTLSGKRNLVYTAPTGGGKSLVADILMLKKVIEHPERKGLLVLPYVSLVQEKLRWLRKAVEGVTKKQSSQPAQDPSWRKRGDENNVRLVGFFGGNKTKASWIDMDIAVCTIEKVRFWSIGYINLKLLTLEKANSLVNAAIEDLSVGNLGVVVIDELHSMCSPS
jgi:CRISPR/Cas system-associated endonuclease/helicase Cas3